MGGDTVGRYRGAITVAAVAAGVVDIAGARLARAGICRNSNHCSKDAGECQEGRAIGRYAPGRMGQMGVSPLYRVGRFSA